MPNQKNANHSLANPKVLASRKRRHENYLRSLK